MGILTWIILGAIAGWLASKVAGRDAQQGWMANIVVGIVGAMIGGYVAGFFGMSGVDGFNLGSLLVAFVGAVILLVGLNAVTGRKAI